MHKRIATWVLTVPVTGLFGLAGLFKFGEEATVNFEQKFGYSDEFRIFIGIAELAGAIGVLVPRLAFWAAAGLAMIMAGAVYTHIQVGEPLAVPLVTGAFCVGIAAFRYDRALFLQAATSSGAGVGPAERAGVGDRPAA